MKTPNTKDQTPSWFALMLALGALALTGCSVVTGSRKLDGSITVRSYRLLWTSEQVKFSTGEGTNFNASLELGKSGTDDQALAAVTSAAVGAAMKAAK